MEDTNGTSLPTRMRASSLFSASTRGVDSTRTLVRDASACRMARTFKLARLTTRTPRPWKPCSSVSPKLCGPTPMPIPRVESPETPRCVKSCQLMPNWLARSRVTSAISTSKRTCGGRTSSCSIVSWSTEKFGGAVRITSELVAWSGTIVVRPTSPWPGAWALSAAARPGMAPSAATDGGAIWARSWSDSISRRRNPVSSLDRLRPSSACTRCRVGAAATVAPNTCPRVVASSAALACLSGYT